MTSSVHISTGRLLLRPLRLDDARELFLYRRDPVANQYQGWIPETINDVYDFIKKGVSPTIDITGTWYQLAIINNESRKIIGDIGLHFIDEERYQVEVGFTLDLKEQGKGYATEAMTGAISYLFNDLGKRRIIASIDPRNVKSIALVSRLGFRQEAHFKESMLIKGEWVDDLIFALLRSEWLKAMGQGHPL